MTFLAPAWLFVAAAAAAGVIALHFFARQRPRPAILPTARFVPDLSARAPSVSRRPSDLVVLLLRVLALLLLGLALARPVPRPARRAVARVVVVAPSRALRSFAAAMDSAYAYAAAGDTLLLVGDSLDRFDHALSPMLVAALRASAALRDRADSIELVLVSSFAEADFDAATDSIRALWPGRARLVRVEARSAPPGRRLEIVGAPDDPLRATVALLGAGSGEPTRIVRDTPTPADSALARGGAVLVEWPRDPAARWSSAPRSDTVGGVMAGEALVVAPFVREARLPELPAMQIGNAAVTFSDTVSRRSPVAFWVDGVLAADEAPLGQGCVRHVAIRVPETGDLVLRRSVGRLVSALAAACRGAAPATLAGDTTLVHFALSAAPLLVSHFAPAAGHQKSAAAGWLLLLAVLLLAGEMVLRNRTATA